MLLKHSRSLVLLLGLCAACGDDESVDESDAGGDAGRLDASLDGGLDGSVGDVLQPGDYTVSNVQSITDGCELELDDGTFVTQRFYNNMNGTEISIGSYYTPDTETSWTPAGYGLGSGPWITSRTTTLTVSSHVKFTEEGVTCEYDTMRTSLVEYTGPNALEIDFTNVQSNHSTGCATFGYPAGTCTSRFTFNLTKPLEHDN